MIRVANIDDLEAMVEIYNQAIDAKFQTAFTEKYRPEDKTNWFYEHPEDRYPLFVYELDGKVVGYLSIGAYRQGRAALRYSVEVSYFIHKDHQKKGIGPQLLAYGINACKMRKYKTLLAIILEPNIGSTKLLEKFGFQKWGYLPGIADFDGVECGQVYYGLKL